MQLQIPVTDTELIQHAPTHQCAELLHKNSLFISLLDFINSIISLKFTLYKLLTTNDDDDDDDHHHHHHPSQYQAY
jgi:hypothetical protein